MKTIIYFSALLLTCTLAFGQDISGKWNGVLKTQGIELPLVFNVTKSENGYFSTMDSPSQGAKDIPTTKTTFENLKLTIEISNAKIEFSGEFKNETIFGIFKQNGQQDRKSVV